MTSVPSMRFSPERLQDFAPDPFTLVQRDKILTIRKCADDWKMLFSLVPIESKNSEELWELGPSGLVLNRPQVLTFLYILFHERNKHLNKHAWVEIKLL